MSIAVCQRLSGIRVACSRSKAPIPTAKPFARRVAGMGRLPLPISSPGVHINDSSVQQHKTRDMSCNAAFASVIPTMSSGMFAACTTYAAALYSMMLVAPVVQGFQRLLRSNTIFLPIVCSYFLLLVSSWNPDMFSLLLPGSLSDAIASGKPQFFPKLQGIMTLFSRHQTVASFWAHILAINLLLARLCLFDGLEKRIPTTHTILLTAVFGPLGYISHQITKAFMGIVRSVSGRGGLEEGAVVLKTERGTITLLPYSSA